MTCVKILLSMMKANSIVRIDMYEKPIVGTFQTLDDGDPHGDPWTKEFENEKGLWEYLRSQMGHPWLSVNPIKAEDKETGDSVKLW